MATTWSIWRRTFVVALALIAAPALGGCGSSAPSASGAPVSSILASWSSVGISCGEPHVGMPENEPQWVCQGTLRGVRVNVDFVADNSGVMDMQAQVPVGTKPQAAAGAFDDLMAATPAFPSGMPAAREWIREWNGSRGLSSTETPTIHVSIDSDDIWITLSLARVPRFGSPTPSGSAQDTQPG